MYYRLTVSTTTQGTDIVSSILIDTGSDGVYIQDPRDILLADKDEGKWDYMGEDVFDYGHEDVWVMGYFERDVNIEAIAEKIKAKFTFIKVNMNIDFGSLDVKWDKVYEEDWENEWKKYFHPTKVSEKIVIKPTWEEYVAKKGEIILSIDPGLAFGSGAHETTKMCIKKIEKYIKSDDTVIDIGCGSGVLSIAALLLGASKVIAVDIDPVAIKVSKENLRVNNLTEKNIKILQGDLAQTVKEKGDIIVANIVADAIIDLAPSAYDLINDGGYFISSGIIEEKKDEVTDALKKNKFEIVEICQDKSWICIVARK